MAKFMLIAAYPSEKSGERQEVRPRHREYLKELVDKGKLFASGPWADDSGACIIYEAVDEAEVRALFAADPFSRSGVATMVSVNEWKLVTQTW